uniref:Uncharacterized protein n=1 Tax=Callorhinchus milii TaxID=7868 RepID=A0A4W3IQA6_CALMI
VLIFALINFTFPTVTLAVGKFNISVSLLAVVVSFCGLSLLVVSLFVFWKLCWPCWRSKGLTSNPNNVPQNTSSDATEAVETPEKKEIQLNGRSSVSLLETSMKISQTSPDIPAEVHIALKDHLLKHTRVQRQTTEPTSSSRNWVIKFVTSVSSFGTLNPRNPSTLLGPSPLF